jgi:hypothetical protein
MRSPQQFLYDLGLLNQSLNQLSTQKPENHTLPVGNFAFSGGSKTENFLKPCLIITAVPIMILNHRLFRSA